MGVTLVWQDSRFFESLKAFSERSISVANGLKIVLVLGSAPDAVLAKNWDLSVFTSRVAINNAWQITPDWDYLVYPEDFASDRLPTEPLLPHQRLIEASEFVPQQNSFGGFVYAGGTMAFTTGYWALGALKPDILAFLGCDMVYATGDGKASHFYGQGTPDPLRADVTLQSLEAKSVRFLSFAHSQHCAVVNLSQLPESRLLFPRVSMAEFATQSLCQDMLNRQNQLFDTAVVSRVLKAEQDLGYMVPSGRYWEREAEFDKTKLSDIDHMWLQTLQAA